MSNDGASAGPLDIGRVIQELFAVLGRNIVTFGLLALILTGIPTAVLYGFQGMILGSALSGGSPTAAFGSNFGWLGLTAMVSGVFGVILQATIIYGTVGDLNARKVSVADSLSTGLRAFLPIIGLAILMGFAIGLGFLLLIVPGVMLAIAWCVAVPSYVVEQPGVIASFGRSAELTRGNRWRIFGLFMIYVVAAIIVQIVLTMFGGIFSLATIGGFPLVTRILILPLIQVANALIGSVGVAVLYVELRRLRDGVGPQGLAAIFD
jgi:hypothetical protein